MLCKIIAGYELADITRHILLVSSLFKVRVVLFNSFLFSFFSNSNTVWVDKKAGGWQSAPKMRTRSDSQSH